MAEQFGNTLIVAPIEPMPQGQSVGRYEPLPLHITIQPWFEAPEREGAFRNAFSNLMFSYDAFGVERGNFDLFGHSKQVDLIERGAGSLAKLHREIGETIVNFAGMLNPSLEHHPFRPHVTRVAGRQVPEKLTIDAVQFVYRQADGSKLIGRRYPFGNRRSV